MTLDELKGMPYSQLAKEIELGGRFVVYTYTISIVLMTFRRPSKIYFIRKGELAIKHGWQYLLLSLLLGWWGIPFGPIYTLQSIWYSFFPPTVNPNDSDLPYNIY